MKVSRNRMENINKYVIIVAGGTGQRFGAKIPKQFVLLAGRPILMHTISKFYNFDKNIKIVVTLPKDYFDFWGKMCHEYHFDIPHQVVEGGVNRFLSVKNGLNAIDSEGLVAIHDAVRPLVNYKTIEECFETADIKGNAIPVVPLIDSIRQLNGFENFQVNRDAFVLVQTPQVFKVSLVKKAYEQEFSVDFTDDASVFEKAGHKIVLTQGNRENIKITNQMDISIAEALLETGNFE